MNTIVTGCKDCPLNSKDAEYGDFCRHPSVRDEEGYDRVIPTDPYNKYEIIEPEWCPLKKESITIELSQ